MHISQFFFAAQKWKLCNLYILLPCWENCGFRIGPDESWLSIKPQLTPAPRANLIPSITFNNTSATCHANKLQNAFGRYNLPGKMLIQRECKLEDNGVPYISFFLWGGGQTAGWTAPWCWFQHMRLWPEHCLISLGLHKKFASTWIVETFGTGVFDGVPRVWLKYVVFAGSTGAVWLGGLDLVRVRDQWPNAWVEIILVHKLRTKQRCHPGLPNFDTWDENLTCGEQPGGGSDLVALQRLPRQTEMAFTFSRLLWQYYRVGRLRCKAQWTERASVRWPHRSVQNSNPCVPTVRRVRTQSFRASWWRSPAGKSETNATKMSNQNESVQTNKQTNKSLINI